MHLCNNLKYDNVRISYPLKGVILTVVDCTIMDNTKNNISLYKMQQEDLLHSGGEVKEIQCNGEAEEIGEEHKLEGSRKTGKSRL